MAKKALQIVTVIIGIMAGLIILLVAGAYFPPGWTARKMHPLGPEQIKGSHDNHPSMFYDSPLGLAAAGLYVSRSDNVEEALQRY